MARSVVRGVDLLAVGAAVVAAAMTLVYRAVMEAQGEESPLWWVQAVLIGAAVLALVAAPTGLRHRAVLLYVAAGALAVLGVLAILTIGLPILLAALLALLSAVRRTEVPSAEVSTR